MTSTRQSTVQLRVPFCDVDSMQVVWHGNYYKYFDAAREKLFDEAGLDLYKTQATTGIVFPVTRCQAKYIRPLRYRDCFNCLARIVEAEFRIIVDFEIRLDGEEAVCTRGRSEQVAVSLPEGTLHIRVPAEIQQALSTVES